MKTTARASRLSNLLPKWILLAAYPAILLNGQGLPGSSTLGVAIKSPSNGSTVIGSVNLTATTAGSTSVLGVQFLLDGAPIVAEVTASPYTATWNTALSSNGLHSLSATARDVLGNRATATISVSVSNAPPPVVSITLGPPSASLSANQTQQFTATVTGSSDTSTSWSINPQVGTISTGGLYTAPGVIASAQSVTVTATSQADPTKTATALIALTAPLPPPDTTPPTISITTPSNGSKVIGTINITAMASDNVGVAGVQFFTDGVPIGGELTAPPYTVSWNSSSVPDGNHTLSGVARDAAGNRNTAAITVSVTNAPPPVVSITLGPASISLVASQTQQFTATVTGSSNTGASWQISPQVGTISTGGLYTAPATIASAQNITVIATSLADSTKTATTTITLTPVVTITLGPASVNLAASQTQQFTATVTGSSNTGASWQISPQVGTISTGGLYTAPATVASAQNITVTATSLADSTKTASVVVTLTPTVSITLGPANTSLSASQTQQFTAAVTGTSNTGVSWSISPTLGTISSSGLYTAPATITSAQNVIVTAASLADLTKTAVAVIALTISAPPPGSTPVSINITAPVNGSTLKGSVGISASATAIAGVAGVQFFADAVPVGVEITAPPYAVNWDTTSVPDGPHSLSAVARDIAGNHTVATISVSVSNATVVSAVTLPVEVIGPDGFTQTVQVNVPTVPGGTLRLWLQIHGLKYQTEASVQVNSSAWIPINDTTVTLLGRAATYGGIGGGFTTLKLTLNLPAGAIVAGVNTLRFRFNGTDGVTSGFRVLNFNLLATDGTTLVSSSNFVQDNPSLWQPPSWLASDISAGQLLWSTANLTVPSGAPIRAKCASCHAQDGRDLKYFNYSNNSIRARAQFHGLTAQQGDQIASYIRTLSAPASIGGRPWNPPYQPGPGMDSKPVTEWAAGAGIDAVLDNDSDMLPYLMPNGSTANWRANAYLNAREIPLPIQLHDWNRWLPTIHPLDAWGDTFTNDDLNTHYLGIRSQLRPNDPVAYANVAPDIRFWFNRYVAFMGPRTASAGDPLWQDPTYVAKIYSEALWTSTKIWELNQEFGLEGMSRVVFGPQAADRAWYTNMVFSSSPFLMRIPRPSVGIGNGSVIAHVYLSFAWYALQLVLNDGNGTASGTWPIDWTYAQYPANDLTWDNINSKPRVGTGGLLTLWLVKALQNATDNSSNPMWMVGFPTQVSTWSEMSTSQKLQIMNGYVSVWLDKYESYSPQALLALNLAPPTLDMSQNTLTNFLSKALPQLRYQGVDIGLLNQVVAWASSEWPTTNWSTDLNAPCLVANLGQVVCTPAN